LYANGDAQAVRLDEYLAEIAQTLVNALAGSQPRVELQLDLDELTVGPKSASALGLILNELLTNVLKYAFPGDRCGFIRVRLERAAGSVILEVADNGVGLPAGFDVTQASGLGLQLVLMLAQQLGGKVYWEQAETTRFDVRVNEKQL
jgi:two-component sensor histidine kinase